MTWPGRSYIEFIQECETLIGAFRQALRANDKEEMGRAYMTLLDMVQPILIREAGRLHDISEGAVREALEGMVDRLWNNLTQLTFQSMETQFGAYLRSMPIRILRKVKEKYRPTGVSLQVVNLDEPANADSLATSEVVADPRSLAEIERLITRLDLQEALAHLPPELRQVVQERVAGNENNAIAAALGVSPATATRLYQRALKQLRVVLQGYSERGAP